MDSSLFLNDHPFVSAIWGTGHRTYLNIVAFVVAGLLVWRFYASGGRDMLAMMGGGPDDMTHDHAEGAHGHGA